MSIHITDWLMVSDISPEYAERVQTRHGSSWLLSWLPGVGLSFEQAYAAMELDEILSDPRSVDDTAALTRAQQQAELAGLVLEQVVHLLANRIEARLMEAQILQHPAAAEPAPYRDDPGIIRSGSAA
ncbi:hypothetical protein [Nocardia carnea]|uniref:Uncharacterized protein n=1 Tax=Nocardia carnea TaxID=37328 RepID=A0ABW7THY8_9NOCA|nr:hypothetical protein [Nocardia carnea]